MPLPHPASAPEDNGITEYLMDVQVLDGRGIEIVVFLRQRKDGVWQGGLRFRDPLAGDARETAEILRGESEADVWLAVRSLRPHHFRDLYRSLA